MIPSRGPARRILRSLPVKFALFVSGVVVATSFVISAYLIRAQVRALTQATLQRGEVLARGLSFNVRSAIVANDRETMRKLLKGVVKERDVLYAGIEDVAGHVLAEEYAVASVTPLAARRLGHFPSDDDVPLIQHYEGKQGEPDGYEVVALVSVVEGDVGVGDLLRGAPPSLDKRMVAVVRVGMSTVNLKLILDQARRTGLYVTLIVIAAGILASLFLIRWITGPIVSLRQAATAVAGGDFSGTVSVRTQDEIGALGRSFNRMIEHIQASRKKLDRYARDLEARVGELDALRRLGSGVSASLDLNVLLGFVVQWVQQELKVGRLAVFLSCDEPATWRYGQGVGWDDPAPARLPSVILRGISAESVAVTAQSARAAHLLVSDPGFPFGPLGLRDVLMVPCVSRSKAIGFMVVDVAGREDVDELHRRLSHAGGEVAMAIDNAGAYGRIARFSVELERKVQERTRQLSDANRRLAASLENLKKTQTQLVQAEKMAGLGQLVGGIAHEINNPSNVIRQNIEVLSEYVEKFRELLIWYDALLSRQEGLKEEARVLKEAAEYELLMGDLDKLIRDIRTGSDRITRIVRDLWNFSRADPREITAYDLHEGIDAALNLLANEMRDRVAVEREFGPIPKLECYAGQLNQVVLNLLSNAVQSIEGKGTVWVRTALVDQAVRLQVKDSGRGIPADMLPRIFDPFLTTKPVGRGVGMGLAVTYEVVRRHNGRIQVTSKPGRGTEFSLHFPLDGCRKGRPKEEEDA